MISTLIGLLAVVAVGTWTYVGNYAAVITHYVEALDRLRPQAEAMQPLYVMRYSDVITSYSIHYTKLYDASACGRNLSSAST